MHPAPYTVTNSYKGGLFMRTYARNVRRAWDADDYYSYSSQHAAAHAPKRICTTATNRTTNPSITFNENDEDSLERAIRETSVAALSSSPSRKNSTIFSFATGCESQDDAYNSPGTVTPPSSPPQQRLTPPVVKARKPTFAFLNKNKEKKRKRAESTTTITTREASEQPLSEVVNSSFGGRVSSTSTSCLPPPPAKKQQTTPLVQQTLVQMRLDLGGDVRKSCHECGMEYVPSNEEDATMHRMYHHMDRDGVELSKAFTKSAMKWSYEMKNIEGSVVIVDRKISLPARRVVQKVLGIVNKELNATPIEDEVLWSQKELEEPESELVNGVKKTESEKRNHNKSDRYKVFLHVNGGKCVGLCLAERITTAHCVKPPATSASDTTTAASSAIEIDDSARVPAVVGVSRIWTSKAFRRKGIAQNLLDCVLSNFVYGMEVEKEELAFSQPTESGSLLARAWFGEECGWRVYKED